MIELLDDTDDESENSYLDNPSQILASMHVTVSKAVTTAKDAATVASATAEKERLLQVSLATFKSSIESFGNPATNQPGN